MRRIDKPLREAVRRYQNAVVVEAALRRGALASTYPGAPTPEEQLAEATARRERAHEALLAACGAWVAAIDAQEQRVADKAARAREGA